MTEREQIAKQCDAVRYLATVLAGLHEDYAKVIRSGKADALLLIVGPRTAFFMEMLGDFLNGMDAASEDDAWLDPIFAEAHRLFPNAKENGPIPVYRLKEGK